MMIYRDIEELGNLDGPVVTIGTFDGVHLGHMHILERLKEVAAEMRKETLVITFHPHPRLVLQQDAELLRFITSLDERIERLRLAGIDHLLVLPFTKELASLSSDDFIRVYISEILGASAVVIGYDHHFGRRARGNYLTLEEAGKSYGFTVERIEARLIGDEPVSSSRIRERIREGDVKTARRLLGYPYFIFGTVVQGNKVGKGIGFPTVNVRPDDPHKLLPSMGVYAGTALVRGRRYKGMINVGIRPTLNLDDLTIEMHIFEFDEDVYGEEIRICLYAWIREERQFSGVGALAAQLHSDRESALRLLEAIDG